MSKNQELMQIIMDFFIKLWALPLWAKAGGAVLAFYTPILETLLWVLLAMGVDVLSAIWASYRVNNKQAIISSSKFKKKVYELIPLGLGATVLLALEWALKAQLNNFTAFGFSMPQHFFSIFFCVLVLLREAISVLENGAKAGFGPSQTLANLLKIKTKELTDKASGEHPEPPQDPKE